MGKNYQDDQTAASYIDFANSENGKIEQAIIFQAISKDLNLTPGEAVLDAACGPGWLAGKLSENQEVKTFGCDYSPLLIKYAKEHYQKVNFQVADLTQRLPYQDGQFNLVIFNMAAHDVANLKRAFLEISRVTQGGGKMFLTVANPYYSFPVGRWKRGVLGFLFGGKPKLKLRPFNFFKNQKNRSFVWNNKFSSHFYSLAEYLKVAISIGLELVALEDLESNIDSPAFNRRYQFYRFPMILLLVFKKPLK